MRSIIYVFKKATAIPIKGIVCLFLMLLPFAIVKAQTGVTVTRITPPSNADQWSVCGEDPGVFNIILGALSDATSVEMTFTLQPGIEYIPGTLSPAPTAEDVSNLQSPVFTMPDFVAGDQPVYTFELRMNCEVVPFLVDQGNEANIIIDITAAEGDNSVTTAEAPFSPFTNSVKIPYLILQEGTNNLANVEVFEPYTRTFEILQTGVNANLYSFTLCMDYEADLMVSNQAIDGNPVTLDANGCLIVDASNAASLGITLPITTNDSYIWSEDVTITGCDDYSTTVTIDWGCDGALCQEEEFIMGAQPNLQAPVIGDYGTTRTFGNCLSDGAVIETEWRLNGGKMYGGRFLLSAHSSSTWIDPNSVELDMGSGWMPVNSADFYNEITTSANNCIPVGEQYTSFNYDLPAMIPVVAPAIFKIRYTVKTCCPTGACSPMTGYILGGYNYFYYESSCGIESSDFSGRSGLYMNSNTADQIPPYMSDGETKSWVYNLNNIPSFSSFGNSGQVCSQLNLGPGVVYQANTVEWISASGINPLSVAEESIVNNPDGSTDVQVCFDGVHGDGSQIRFDVSYMCDVNNCAASSVATTMKMGYRFGDGTCVAPDDCLMTFLCETGNTILEECCPGVSCTGLCPLYTITERTCFGAPDNDNDGCPDAGGMIDPTKVRLDKAMQGDELSFVSEVDVNIGTDLGVTSFDYIYLEMAFPNEHSIGSDNTLEIYDASADATYTCTAVNVFESTDGQNIKYYLITDLIRGCGDIPTDFVYENGDKVKISGSFVNLYNPACTQTQAIISMNWYAGLAPDPVGPDRLTCCSDKPATYTQVGYTTNIAAYSNQSYGCGGAIFGYNFDFCIGGSTYINPFPYEVRNFMKPAISGLVIPDGLTLDKMEITQRYFTKHAGTYVYESAEDVTAFTSETNGAMEFDWNSYFNECTTEFAPNGGYRLWMRGYFNGSCNSVPSVPYWYHESDMDYCSVVMTDETLRFDGNHGGNLAIVIPEITASSSIPIIQPYNEDADWIFMLRETKGRPAFNSWVVFTSPSGDIVPVELSKGGSVINPINGVYPLGTVNGGSIANFNLTASYASCGLDSLRVLYGWDCDQVPASDQEAIQGGLPCPSSEMFLYLEPRTGSIQQEVLVQPTGPVLACEPLDFEIEVSNVGDAELFKPLHEIYLPYTLGMEIIPGTEQACYPCDPNNPVYNYGIATPGEVNYLPQGIKYTWDLEDLVNEFDYPTLGSWPGYEQSQTDVRKLRIKFQAEVGCDFIGGDFIRLRTAAETYCGDHTQSLLQNVTQISIQGQTVPYPSSMYLDLDQIPVDACGDAGTATINGGVLFFGETDGLDTLIIALPPVFTYSSVLFNPDHVSNPIPTINSFGPSPGSDVVFQELRWAINSDIPSLTNIPFELNVNIDPDQVLCVDDNLILMRAVRTAIASCDGVDCNSLVQTGARQSIIEVEKNEFEFDDFIVSTNCGMTELMIENITVRDTGTYDITQDITIDFYHDTDENGAYSIADELLGSTTLSEDIPVGESRSLSAGPFTTDPSKTCKIIALASGCICDAPEIRVSSLLSDNSGGEVSGCSSGFFNLGCGEDLTADGFTYQWFGLNGAAVDSLDDTSIPNPVLSYTHTNSNDYQVQYALLTTHPNGVCNSVDTVTVTLKGVAPTVGPLLKVCAGEQGILSGPTGFTDYQWSPTTGLTDPNDPQTAIAAPTGVQVYTLSYTDAGSCTAFYEQSVKGVSCTELELDKAVDVANAAIGDIITYTITLTNQGPNGASGIQVFDSIPVQLNYLSSTPAGEYDPNTHLWTIPNVMLPDDIATLTIEAEVISGGPLYNVAEIYYLNEGDIDGTQNNDDPTEDDQDGVCTAVPIDLACREIKTIHIPDEFTSYQWFKDGVAIAGAVADSINITESGEYAVEVDGGACPYGNCCPYVVTEEPCANIGGYAWEDYNGDGIQEGTEVAIEGIEVILYDADTGLPFDTVYTQADGTYLIEEVPSGNYYVEFDIDTNTTAMSYQGTAQGTGDGTNDSEPDATGTTPNFSFDAANGDDITHDAGYQPIADIGDFFWVDTNQNGLQELGEPGLEGVSVSLYDVATNMLVAITMTNVDGEYIFMNIPPGDYYINYDFSTVPPGQAYIFTINDTGNGANDSEADFTTGNGPNFTFDPNAGNDMSHDAGVLAVADIGDYVWFDQNIDGIQDASENGVEGVMVILYDAITNMPIDTMFTDADGLYLFEDVVAGDYYITINTDSAGAYAFTYADYTGDDTNDSDVDIDTGNIPTFTFDPWAGDDMNFDAGIFPCGISIDNLAISCDDQNCSSTTLVDFRVSWDASIVDDIEVTVGGNIIIIPISTGATSPYNIEVNMPADGSTGHNLIAELTTTPLCRDVAMFDAAVPCDCASNAILIDDFSTDIPVTVLNNEGSSTQYIVDNQVISGERDIETFMTVSDNPFNIQTYGDGGTGIFTYNEGGTVRGGFTITYDGTDGDPNVLDATGLGNLDLTNGGLLNLFAMELDADQDFDLRMEVYTDAANYSTYDVPINGSGGLLVYEAPYASFTTAAGTGADFTNVGAIRLMVNTTGTTGDLDMLLHLLTTSCNSCSARPTAVADKLVAAVAATVTIPVQSNDIEPNGQALTTSLISQPTNGVAFLNGNDIDYTPNPGYVGVDQFEYQITNLAGSTDQAMVTIIVSNCGNPTIIDVFDTESPYTAMINTGSTYESVSAATALGNERDIETFMTVSDPDFNLFTYGSNVEGFFSYIEGGPVRGGFQLIYDGADGDASTLDPVGLGGVDLTANGNDALELALKVDNNITMLIEVYTDAANASVYNLPLVASTETEGYTIPYGLFTTTLGTGADFTNVGAITLRIETTATSGNLDMKFECIFTGCSNNNDYDEDGIADLSDPDDDNDGIPDWIEAGCASMADFGTATCPDPADDDDNDGVPNYQDMDFCTLNALGVCANYDTDNDGIPDFFDTDSDNDGVADWVESGNGNPPSGTDTDGDGIDDAYDSDNGGTGLSTMPQDSDNDGTPDAYDTDSDNDGIADWAENNNTMPTGNDTDNDGIDDAYDMDNGGSGFADTFVDTDGDGTPDLYDEDSDNDGIPDWLEADNIQPTNMDDDNDGIDNAYDTDNGGTGVGTNNTDTDADGIPDALDPDSDNDGIADWVENDNAMPTGMDTDGDGIDDAYDPDNGGEGIDDAFVHTDMDGNPDFRDEDSDDDCIDDAIECPDGEPCPDTDNDGTPDFRDLDADGDGALDADECPNCGPCEDIDDDGIPDFLDTLCNLVLTTPNITTNSPVCVEDTIFMYVQESYVHYIEGTSATINYTWINGNASIIAQGDASSLSLAANDVSAISPFSVQVNIDDCESPYSPPAEVEIIQRENITAGNSGPVCDGESVTLFVSTVDNANYQWYRLGDPTLLSTESAFIIDNVMTMTTYQVIVETALCEPDTATTIVNVGSAATVNPTADYMANANCAPTDLSLFANATTSGGLTITTYYWEGPNGFISTSENPVIPNASSANNGFYSLIVTDSNDCSTEASVEVNNVVDAAVTQPLISSSGPDCNGGTITLTTQVQTGVNVTYTWNTPAANTMNISGFGTNEIVLSPIDESIHEGNYSVTVEVDGCIASSTDFYVEVFDDPTASPSATAGNICDEGQLELFANATNANTYSWNGPNNFVSNLENPVLNNVDESYNGDYVLTIISTSGCSITTTVAVSNILAPPAMPTISVNAPNCEGQDLIFATDVTGDLYEWIGPLGSSPDALSTTGLTTTTPTTTLTSSSPAYLSGMWSVRVTDANGCISTSNGITVNINEVPTAVADNEGPICEGETVRLLASPVADAAYYWYDNDPNGSPAGNLISTEQQPVLNNLAGGTYIYYLQLVKDACLSEVVTTTVVINQQPTAMPNANYTLNADCSPSDLALSANPTGTAPFTFAWTGPNNFISNEENPVIPNATTANNGSYVLNIVDDNGCTTEASLEVSGISDAVSQPIISSTGPSCEGGSVVLSIDAYSGASVSYTWTTPNGTMLNISGENTNQLVISGADANEHEGDYSVEVVVDGCTLNSDIYTLDIFETPTVAPTATTGIICEGGEITLTANASNAVSYTWVGPNGFTSNAADPILSNVSVNNNGTYTLTISNANDCTATASIEVTNITLTPAQPTVTTASEVCIDGTITLAIQEQYTGNTITYNWTNGEGTNIGTTSTISLAANDANAISPFRVSVTVDDCPSDLSAPAEVIIYDLPAAIATNAGAICPGEDAQLFANTIGGASYEWRISGSSGIISTEQNPVVTGLTDDLTFELTVISNTCISDPVSLTTVVVNDAPSVAPNANYTLNPDCSPSDLELVANVTLGTGAITSYAWTGPNNFTSVEENPIIANATTANNGSYVLVVADENDCSATGTIEVTDISDSVAEPLISSTGPACEGEVIILTIPEYSGATVSYNWNTPNNNTVGISGLNSNEITISPVETGIHEGDYSVTIVVDGCTLDSDIYTVDVFEMPTAAPSSTGGMICDGAVLELMANATGPAPLSYEWVGPNGFNSTLENVNITDVDDSYNGQYTLTVSTVSGCKVIESIFVTNILAAPEVPVITVQAPVCNGEDMILSTSTIGDTYEWIGPLGASPSVLALSGLTTTTSTTAIAASSQAYLSGDWQVRVTDVNGCIEISTAIMVTIHDVPVAIAENDSPVCEGGAVQLSASTVDNVQYYWYDAHPTSGGTLISTEQNPVLLNLATGSYDYYLQLDNNGCLSEVSITTVVINSDPTLAPTSSYTLNADCSPADLTLITNPMGVAPFTFNWAGPNGFVSTEENPVIPNATSDNNGSYSISIVDANGCSATETLEVSSIVDALAQPQISTSGPSCEGGSITLTIPQYDGTMVSYNWSTPNDVTTNITGLNTNQIVINPVNGAIHNGDYSVEVIVDGCELNSDIYTVEVFEQPTAAPTATADDICESGLLELFANATLAESYEWEGPNGFTSSAENPQIANVSVANNGTYTLTIYSESACSITESIVINNIKPTPEQPTITTNSPVCIDENIQLFIQENYTGDNIRYAWTNGEGTTISTDPSVTIAADDALAISPYRVVVTVDVCDSEQSVAAEIVVNPLPEAIATNNGPICPYEPVQLFASPVEGASYEWRRVGSSDIISTEVSPMIFDLTEDTDFELTVISNACVSEPVAITSVDVHDSPVVAPSSIYIPNDDCSPSDLELFANETAGSGTITTYSWTGPNNFVSAIANPIITEAMSESNGTYTLMVTDENGCTTEGSILVTTVVDQVAEPIISSSGPACEGQSINLYVQEYQGASVTYQWTTPNGTTDISGLNTNQIVISPANANLHQGDYSVEVVVDGCTVVSDIYNLEVFETPTAAPTATTESLCEGELLELFANATLGESYEWEGPNGFVSNAENPQIANVSIANNGTYTLTVYSESACSVTESIDIENIQETPIQPTITTNSPVCINENIQLFIQESYVGNNITYTWTNGEGTVIGTNADVVIAASNSAAISPYRVIVAINGCESDLSEPAEVIVNPLPEAIATNNGPICPYEPVQLFASAVEGASYEWRRVGSSIIISTEQNPIISDLTQDTNFELTVISNDCVSNPLSVTMVDVHVLPTVTPDALYVVNNDCSPSDLQLFANTTQGSGTISSYNWTGPNGFTSTAINPIITEAMSESNGTYTLIVIDENECSVEGTVQVTTVVDEAAEPVISSSGPACEGQSISLSVQSYEGSSVTYQWTTPNGTADISGLNTNEIVISPANASLHQGNYSVRVVVDNCTIDSDIYNLEVFETPTLSPMATSEPLCEGDILELFATANNADSYLWEGPNGFTSTAANPQIDNITINNNGTYTLTVYSESACSATASVDVENIQATPVKPTITTNSPVCINENIFLYIQEDYGNSQLISYQWTNGAGNVIGIGDVVTIAANSPNAIAPYRVLVSVGNCGSELSDPADVTVNPLPEAIATNDGAICPGEEAQLYANPIEGALYEWRILGSPAIISTEQAPMLMPSTTTDYQLTVILDDCVSNPLDVTTIVVYDAPTVDPAYQYMMNADCSPSDLMLFANELNGSGAIISFEWTGPNGFTSAEENPIITEAMAGTNGSYVLVVTDENGCTNTGSVEVTTVVDEALQPVIVSSGPACKDGEIILSVQEYFGANVDYSWATPNGTLTDITGFNSNEITISPVDPAIHQGNYFVVVNIDGCEQISDIFYLETYDTPVAVPTVESAEICEGETLQLYSEVANTYYWTGPNSFESTTQNPSIENANPDATGTYYLMVTNEQGCESIVQTVEVVVYPKPEQATLVTDDMICEDEPMILTTSAICDRYLWVGPRGASDNTLMDPLLMTTTNSTTIPAGHELYEAGLWAIICISADGCYSEMSDQIDIQIHEIPEMPIISSSSTEVCAYEPIQLFAGDGYSINATYNWYDANPNLGAANQFSSVQNPIITALPVAGTYTFWLTVTVNDCTSPAGSIEITFTDPPVVAANNDGTECIEPNTDVNLTASPSGGILPYTFSWTGPNGFTSSEQNPVLPNATNELSGTYTVVLMDGNNCTAKASTEVDVTLNPQDPYIVSDETVCAGETIVLTAPVYEGTNVTYEWIGPKGTTTSGAYPDAAILTIAYAENADSGDYQVQVSVNGCNSIFSASHTISILEMPIAMPSNDGASCLVPGADVVLNANVNGGTGIYTYTWTGPNGFIAYAENPVLSNVDETASGTYTLNVEDSNGCKSVIASTVVEVTIQPSIPEITVSAIELCEGSSLYLSTTAYVGETVRYNWTMADGTIIETAEPGLLIDATIMEVHNGLFTVSVSIDDCLSQLATPVSVVVNEAPNLSMMNNSTSEFGPACLDATIQFETNFIAGASYAWYGPNGFTSDLPNPSIATAALVDTGTYYLIVELDGCTSVTGETQVYVQDTPATPVAANTGPFCEATDIVLQVATPDPEQLYTWYRSVDNSIVGEGVQVIIPNATESDEGNYYCIGKIYDCESERSNETFVGVDQVAVDAAHAGLDMIICEDTVDLQAYELISGEGIWSHLYQDQTSIIVTPDDESTVVKDLALGDNYFVWSVNSGACGITSQDTISVRVNTAPEAYDDIYNLELNENLVGNLLTNDYPNTDYYLVTTITGAENGDLVINEDGSFKYIPDENYIGEEEITYELCHLYCPENCIEARLIISIGLDAPCLVPSIMTPNNDGINDYFVIPCLYKYPQSKLTVFNRWGDEVYYDGNYANDWEGVYMDKNDLPVGTYFYMIEKDDGRNTVLSGYIYIHR